MANNKFKNLVGMKFNMLTVVRKSDKKSSRGVVWLCKCDCGGFKDVVSSELKIGNVKSCGCIKRIGLEVGQKSKKSTSINHSCPSCNIIFKVKPSRLKRSSYVCCSMACREKYLSRNPHFRGNSKIRSEIERFFDEKATRLKMSAKKRGKYFDDLIDGGFLLNLWNNQNGKCFYSNANMSFDPKDKLRLISVDRIDNDLGYTSKNIVLCCYSFNAFKFNLNHSEVIEFIKLIREAK